MNYLGLPVVDEEHHAACLYDVDANEVIAYASGYPKRLQDTKEQRERELGHEVVYLGFGDAPDRNNFTNVFGLPKNNLWDCSRSTFLKHFTNPVRRYGE